MWKWVGLGVGGLLLAGAALWLLLLVSIRFKFSPVLTAIRRMNRVLMNPRAMRTAGQPGAYASVIQHVGRISGTRYETPVGAVDSGDGVLIALPYGTSPDWLKNVIAAESGVVVTEGNTFSVEAPQLVGAAQANGHFSSKEQRVHRLYGIDQILYLRKVI